MTPVQNPIDSPNTNQLYFACDWIVNSDEFSKLCRLINTAKEMGCRLKDSPYEFGLETKEGYALYRFVIEVPSTSVLQEFVQRVALPESLFASQYPVGTQTPKPTHFSDWYPVSRHYFDQISILVAGEIIRDLGEYDLIGTGTWIDVASFYADRNRQLGELLATRTAEYYACEWIIPGSQPDGWLRLLIDPFHRYKIRVSGSRQNEDGFHIQRMIARVFDREDLIYFVRKSGARVGLSQWDVATETEFFNALPITDNIQMIALPGLMTEVKNLETVFNRMGQTNEELRQ